MSTVNIHVEAESKMDSDEHVTKIGILLAAASRGDGDKVKVSLDDIKDPNSHDYDNRTGLMLAACGGHLALVKLFHERGADLNFQDRWGNTAMDEAAKNHHDDICNFLTEKGAKKPQHIVRLLLPLVVLIFSIFCASTRFQAANSAASGPTWRVSSFLMQPATS